MSTEFIHQTLAKKFNETSKPLLTVDVCANIQVRSYVGIIVDLPFRILTCRFLLAVVSRT